MNIVPSGASGRGSTHSHLGVETVGMVIPSIQTMGSISSCLDSIVETLPDEGNVTEMTPPRYFRMELSNLAPVIICTGYGNMFMIDTLFIQNLQALDVISTFNISIDTHKYYLNKKNFAIFMNGKK